jgi:hypothetical protein
LFNGVARTEGNTQDGEKLMDKEFSIDWWRYELYRHIAHFVHNPADHTQAKLTALINEFRRCSEIKQARRAPDEHEYAMNYC